MLHQCARQLAAARDRRNGCKKVVYKHDLAKEAKYRIIGLISFYGETLQAIAFDQGGAEVEAALRGRSVPKIERLVDRLRELERVLVDTEGFPVIHSRDTQDD